MIRLQKVLAERGVASRRRAEELITGGRVREASLDLEIGARRSTRRMNRLLEPDRRWRVNALSGERRIDRFGIPFRPSPNNGEILFRNTLLLHHQAKPPGRSGVLRHKHQPAGFPVESIHDRNLSTIRDLEREQMS